MLQKKTVLKTKLTNRAHKSENDIKSGKIFLRADIDWQFARYNIPIMEPCLKI
jgi:hypothetical protein